MSELDKIYFKIPGEPVPFGWTESSGKRRFTPARQHNFMELVKLFASRAMEGKPPLEGALQLTVKATYLHPQSWSKTKKAKTYRKTSRPDLSNILKLLEDAMKAVVWIDDSQVSHIVAEKVYGDRAEVQVFVYKMDA